MHTAIRVMELAKAKVVVVTGANSGLGYHTVHQLALHGAKVVLATRDLAKGETARAMILRNWPRADIDVMVLDLASFDSINTFVKELFGKYDEIDILINNAGMYFACIKFVRSIFSCND